MDPDPFCSLEQHEISLKVKEPYTITLTVQKVPVPRKNKFFKTVVATKKDEFRTIPLQIIVAPVPEPGCQKGRDR